MAGSALPFRVTVNASSSERIDRAFFPVARDPEQAMAQIDAARSWQPEVRDARGGGTA